MKMAPRIKKYKKKPPWENSKFQFQFFLFRLSFNPTFLLEIKPSHRLPKLSASFLPKLLAHSSQSFFDRFNFPNTISTNCLSSSNDHSTPSSSWSCLCTRIFRFGGDGGVVNRARLLLGVENGFRNSRSEFSLSTPSISHTSSLGKPGNAAALTLLFFPTIDIIVGSLRGVLGGAAANPIGVDTG